jgi:LysM repeat protein
MLWFSTEALLSLGYMRRNLIMLLVLAGLLWMGSSMRRQETAEAAPLANAAEMMDLVNQFRAENGLPAFQYNSSLAFAAQSHANWMGGTGVFSHTGANGSSPQSRANEAGYNGWVSENIVGGQNMTARGGLLWWRNSPVHYNTIVSTRYTQAGTGFALTGNGQKMYVLVVGAPSSLPPSSNSSSTEDSSAAPLIITPIQLAEPNEDGSIIHVIQAGQSLWMVAAYYDSDLDYLYQINGMTENDFVQPGDEVYVQLADGQPPPPTPTPRLTYRVQDGDSSWLIAARHSIELDFFLGLNGIAEEDVLQPGTEVRVHLAEGEEPPPTPTPPITYRVQEGDSLWAIAAKNDLTIDQLMAWNNLNESSFIVPGDELTIREVEASPTPTAVFTTTTIQTDTVRVEVTVDPSIQTSPNSTPQIQILRSPTPTRDDELIEEMLAEANMAAPTETTPAPEESGESGSIGILIMAVSLIGMAALMLYFANRQ